MVAHTASRSLHRKLETTRYEPTLWLLVRQAWHVFAFAGRSTVCLKRNSVPVNRGGFGPVVDAALLGSSHGFAQHRGHNKGKRDHFFPHVVKAYRVREP